MPIFEHDMDLDSMRESADKCICGECNGSLTIAWGGKWGWNEYILRCANSIDHHTIKRPFLPSVYDIPGFNLFNLNKKKEEMMTNQFGEKGVALAKYHGAVSLTKAEAKEILLTVFPDAPEVEMQRAVLLCSSYQLNPLMGHIFLIPFKGQGKTTWATVIGIKAKRLLASRKRSFSYLDDSPRIMMDEEQKKIFGKVDDKYIFAVTILQNPKTGAIARGYGKWEAGKEPYGTDKGNSAENMAFIRSESQALDRLCPGEMPQGVGVLDEEYAPSANLATGEFVEGEFQEVMKTSTKATPKAKTSPINPENVEFDDTPIGNLGDLWTRCKNFGITKSEGLELLELSSQEEITDLDKDWKTIFERKFPEAIPF